MFRSILPRASALSAALALGACLFDSNPPPAGVSGLGSPWIGKPLDSLSGATALAFRDGRLFVANRDAAAPGVAVVDTGTGLITEYYPQLLPPGALAFTASGHLVVTETDYTQGAVSVINLQEKRIRQSLLAFGADNFAAEADGRVHLFDRTTGAVTGFAGNVPGKGVVLDVQAGAGSNPYDIAVLGNKAYVPRYNSSHLLILGDASRLDGGARDSIDLSAYGSATPPDSAVPVPRMSHVVAHGDHVFVALQRLNYRYAALDTSLVVVIRASTRAVEAVIPLQFRNPVSAAVRDGIWYLTGLAGYGDKAGGVERINLETRQHAGVVFTEAAADADLFGFVASGAGRGYASWSNDFGFTTRVRKVSF